MTAPSATRPASGDRTGPAAHTGLLRQPARINRGTTGARARGFRRVMAWDGRERLERPARRRQDLGADLLTWVSFSALYTRRKRHPQLWGGIG